MAFCAQPAGRNQSNLHFDPQLLGFWLVMNIINSIDRGGSPCVLPPPSTIWPRSEHYGKGAPEKVACAECTQNESATEVGCL